MNTQITEDYCSFEVTKLLKEKGFEGEIHTIFDEEGYTKLAITYQTAMKWLRDEKNIHIKIHCSGNRNYLVYAQSLVTAFQDICIESTTCSFNSYEEAVEAAIKYCLTNLI